MHVPGISSSQYSKDQNYTSNNRYKKVHNKQNLHMNYETVSVLNCSSNREYNYHHNNYLSPGRLPDNYHTAYSHILIRKFPKQIRL